MAVERTYIMVKPDGVERRLSGEIIRRFENRGLTLVGLKMLVPTRETAQKHYAVHSEKPFFGELVEPTITNPIHVTGHPKDTSPLAKGDPRDPRLTERFESFCNTWEIANGF
ncbi:MAG: nucleoside-diphosphate kinase, partial [Armatimonadota bacterium]